MYEFRIKNLQETQALQADKQYVYPKKKLVQHSLEELGLVDQIKRDSEPYVGRTKAEAAKWASNEIWESGKGILGFKEKLSPIKSCIKALLGKSRSAILEKFHNANRKEDQKLNITASGRTAHLFKERVKVIAQYFPPIVLFQRDIDIKSVNPGQYVGGFMREATGSIGISLLNESSAYELLQLEHIAGHEITHAAIATLAELDPEAFKQHAIKLVRILIREPRLLTEQTYPFGELNSLRDGPKKVLMDYIDPENGMISRESLLNDLGDFAHDFSRSLVTRFEVSSNNRRGVSIAVDEAHTNLISACIYLSKNKRLPPQLDDNLFRPWFFKYHDEIYALTHDLFNKLAQASTID